MANVGGGQSNRSPKAAALLAMLLTVDGAGSGLDADLLDGADWAAPAAIGSGTPAAGSFTTLSATGALTLTAASSGLTVSKTTGTTVTIASTNAASITTAGGYTSTVATGTAPFTATSTTVCPNLNAALLNGTTWTAPGAIGGGTPAAGSFTTLTGSGQAAFAGTANANACLTVGGSTPAAIAGTTEYGMFIDFRSDSSATANTRAAFYRAGTAASAYTSAIVAAIVVGNTILGAGSTITRGYGIQLSQQTSSTNNYGLVHSTGTPSTGNYFIYDDAGYASKVSGVWTYTDTTDASAVGTASVVLTGGIGIAKAAFIGTSATATAITAIGGTTAASLTVSDAGTTNAPSALILNHTSSGTPAAQFGVGIEMRASSASVANRAQAFVQTQWVVATDASRTARVYYYASDFNGNREFMRGEASGSAAMIGFLGASAIVRFATTGTATGFTAGGGTTATHLSTFTGNSGSTAYTVGDLVLAMKNYGLLTP